MMTSLRGPDGVIYAMAQGKLQVESRPGKSSGSAGPKHLLAAQITNGASVEKEIAYHWADLKEFRYQLHHADFTTAARIAVRINEELSGRYAIAEDAGAIQVVIPYGSEANPVDLIAQIESIDVEADSSAKVIVNPRTGTVVLGDSVRILPVAIAHGNLSVEVKSTRSPANEEPNASKSEKNKNKVMMVNGSASISDLVAGLNEMGATPDDLIAILKSLKSSGALLAELEIQ